MPAFILQLRRLTPPGAALVPWSRLVALLTAAVILSALILAAPVAARPFNLPWVTDRALHTIAHLTIWALVGLMLTLGMGRWAGLAWPLGLLLAAAEELHQSLVPGRTVDMHDWLLNAAAVTAAVILVLCLRRRVVRGRGQQRLSAA